MNGSDLVAWRKANGYSQEALMGELDVRSRQTISSWENSGKSVPRLVELALMALERIPECRQIGGKGATVQAKRAYFKEREAGYD